ncbi:MAG: hypothetical protein LBR73_00410 [Oscillospiraceae bacterium]|jgi:bacterioferritin|nr:hypothetical protein [Oscillospiraceae bacterium]
MAVTVTNQPMPGPAAYRLPDLYPIPTGLTPNLKTARLLKKAYAGRHSELGALTQYIVHHEACTEAEAEASKAFVGIAVVEMHHLDMLGGLIRQLGGCVRLTGGGSLPLPFTTKWNVTGDTLEENIRANIKGEEICIQSYRDIITELGDSPISELLARIVKDEVVHLEILRGLLGEGQTEEPDPSVPSTGTAAPIPIDAVAEVTEVGATGTQASADTAAVIAPTADPAPVETTLPDPTDVLSSLAASIGAEEAAGVIAPPVEIAVPAAEDLEVDPALLAECTGMDAPAAPSAPVVTEVPTPDETPTPVEVPLVDVQAQE